MQEITLKIPAFGDASQQMVVIEWFVEEGAEVKEGDILIEVETDKANIDVPSLVRGFVVKHLVNKGDLVKPGDEYVIVVSVKPQKTVSIPSTTSSGFAGVMVRLGVICEHCNHAIPVNGFMQSVKCKCNETTELKGKLRWAEVLNYQNPNIDIFKATLKHKPGEGDYGAWAPVKLKTWRKWPKCMKCDHEFEAQEVEAAINGNKVLSCKKCAYSNTLKPAPQFIKEAFPQVEYYVDPLPAATALSGTTITGKSPVVMACMSCGGSLEVDGTTRLVPCKFCGSHNYLPDDLWFALHPQPKMQDWFVVFRSQ